MLFKQNMTPSWLASNASYITNHTKTNQQITFQKGDSKFAALLKVPLVTAGDLSDNTPLTIRIVVANDVNIAQSTDTDPYYGLSDRTNFVGFKTPDEGSYDKRQPCFGLEGFSGEKLNVSNNAIESKGDEDGISFPDKFVFTFKLNQEKGGMPWGKCFIAQGEGFTREVQYRKRRLKLNRGLTLEVYKTNAKEEVGIKYIEVTICLDSCPLH